MGVVGIGLDFAQVRRVPLPQEGILAGAGVTKGLPCQGTHFQEFHGSIDCGHHDFSFRIKAKQFC